MQSQWMHSRDIWHVQEIWRWAFSWTTSAKPYGQPCSPGLQGVATPGELPSLSTICPHGQRAVPLLSTICPHRQRATEGSTLPVNNLSAWQRATEGSTQPVNNLSAQTAGHRGPKAVWCSEHSGINTSSKPTIAVDYKGAGEQQHHSHPSTTRAFIAYRQLLVMAYHNIHRISCEYYFSADNLSASFHTH